MTSQSPLGTPAALPHAGDAFAMTVKRAAQRLHTAGWRVRYVQLGQERAWHVVASNGTKWRVVQVLPPGASAASRQAGRQLLGASVMVPARLGTMEQWVAHVQPGGRVSFGADVLSGYAWGGEDTSPDALQARLARLAAQAGALTPMPATPALTPPEATQRAGAARPTANAR